MTKYIQIQCIPMRALIRSLDGRVTECSWRDLFQEALRLLILQSFWRHESSHIPFGCIWYLDIERFESKAVYKSLYKLYKAWHWDSWSRFVLRSQELTSLQGISSSLHKTRCVLEGHVKTSMCHYGQSMSIYGHFWWRAEVDTGKQ